MSKLWEGMELTITLEELEEEEEEAAEASLLFELSGLEVWGVLL